MDGPVKKRRWLWRENRFVSLLLILKCVYRFELVIQKARKALIRGLAISRPMLDPSF